MDGGQRQLMEGQIRNERVYMVEGTFDPKALVPAEKFVKLLLSFCPFILSLFCINNNYILPFDLIHFCKQKKY